MISKKQKQIYDFIASFSKENSIAPSLEEIAEHFDFLQYPSSAHYHVKKLQDEGYLERESNKPRSIGLFADKSVKTPFLKKIGMDSIRVPVLGAANAGPATLLAEENVAGYLKVSQNTLARKDGVFALRVEGDSMNKAKIDGRNLEEGDFVLIDSEYKTPRNGDYVLSVIDGLANLKKFQRDQKTGDVMLVSESKNPKHKPIYVSSEDDFMINGRIIGVVKR
ncbi:MAG: transcriptional repressor LexA [Candidatus Paceibacterota bacterium]